MGSQHSWPLERTLRANETTEKQLEELGAWPRDSGKEHLDPLSTKQEEATQVPCNARALQWWCPTCLQSG